MISACQASLNPDKINLDSGERFLIEFFRATPELGSLGLSQAQAHDQRVIRSPSS